jgi:hypothetical protein
MELTRIVVHSGIVTFLQIRFIGLAKHAGVIASSYAGESKYSVQKDRRKRSWREVV